MNDALSDFLNQFTCGDPHREIASVLDRIRETGGFQAVLLSSACDPAHPEPPVFSTQGWNERSIRGQGILQGFSEFLSTCHGYRIFPITSPVPPALDQLRALLASSEPCGYVVIPLPPLLGDPQDANLPIFQKAVVGVWGRRKSPEENTETLLCPLMRLIVRTIRDHEFTPLHTRAGSVAKAFDEAVFRLLEETPQPNWHTLVETIRGLINCDTCQLYLYPDYTEQYKETRDKSRIWLVAEDSDPRQGLRYYYKDDGLTTYLWKNPYDEPLAIPNLPQSPLASEAVGKFGHARHFLGMVLRDPIKRRTLGIIKLRDNFMTVEGERRITADGFSSKDAEVLKKLATELIALLTDRSINLNNSGSNTDGPPPDPQVKAKVDGIRKELSADTCLLFLTPDVPDGNAYAQLYYTSRESWIGKANYAPGEGFTGTVLQKGKDDNKPNMLVELKANLRRGNGRYPKYRISQHVLGVPIKLPKGFEDAGKCVGVLKVRDRLENRSEASSSGVLGSPEGKSLSAQGFSEQDMHLLQAFANMISIKMLYQMQARKLNEALREERRKTGDVFQHDIWHMVEAVVAAAPKKRKELKKKIDDFLDRSITAVFVGDGRYKKENNPRPCNVEKTFRALVPKASLPEAGEKNELWLSLEDKIDGDLWVRCEEVILELAILALPAWLYHQVGYADQRQRLDVKISAARKHDESDKVVVTLLPKPSPLELQGRAEQGYHIYYQQILACPAIPLEKLEDALKCYDAKLHLEQPAGQLRQIEITFQAAKHPS